MTRLILAGFGALLAVTIAACRTKTETSAMSDVVAARERLVCKGMWVCENPADKGPIQTAIPFNPARPDTRPDPADCEKRLTEELKRREPCAKAAIMPGSTQGTFESYEIQLISPGSGLGARLDSILTSTTATMREGCNGGYECTAHIRILGNAARQLNAIAKEVSTKTGAIWECSTATEDHLRKFLTEACEGDYEGSDCEGWAIARNALKVNAAAICRFNPAAFCPDFFCKQLD